ncbi:MAG: hypothetical protein JXA11_10485 [Phycisphaerae bacterium]|nr:hypothetical protein [Phycisphaerae bacterium]
MSQSHAKDRQIVRDLARRVAEIASDPVQAERAEAIRSLNRLNPTRPVVLVFPEGAWRECMPDGALLCTDERYREVEKNLRMRIWSHENIDDDWPVAAEYCHNWVVRRSNYGMEEVYERTEEHGSHIWRAPLKEFSDLDKLHFRTLEVDREATRRHREFLEETMGDILEVRRRGSFFWSCGLTWDCIRLRGLEQMMMDMYDHPRQLHRLMAFLRDDKLHEIQRCEDEDILSPNWRVDYAGSGGCGLTDELPAADFDGQVRTKDMWVLGESQETVGVGPAQFEEFVLQYQLPILRKFGLVCYGCCEPLDKRFDLLIQNLPNLRRLSISPWCNQESAAEKLGRRYIFSRKPNPTLTCAPTVNWDEVEQDLRHTYDVARSCCLEIVLKDTHTFHNDTTRPGQWVKLARKVLGM